MADLQIELLGTPRISWQGQPLRIQRQASRLLLYYLACQPKPVSRQNIISIFWPDLEDDEDGRKNLRETLSRLKKQLPDDDFIVLDHDLVSLDFTRVRVDVFEFIRMFNEMQAIINQVPRNQPYPQATLARINEALALWSNSRFMAGVLPIISANLDRWYDAFSSEIEHKRVSLLVHLADHALATGNLSEAYKLIQSALESDEFNENLHFRALTCLIQMGQRGDAVNYCKKIEEKFRSEGLEINEDLAHLIQSTRLMPISGDTDGLKDWPSLLSTFLPFVGHLEPLGQLHQVMQRGGCIFIAGESGAGKTRLIYEFSRSLPPGTRLLLADSRPSYVNMPFQPIVEGLRHLVQKNEWAQIEPSFLGLLLPLMPELVVYRPDVTPVFNTTPGNLSPIFEAMRHVLLRLSDKRRLLFVMDDAQWCDEASFSFLVYLISHRFFPYHGALVIAARDDNTVPALETFLNQVSMEMPLQRIQLERLTHMDISTLTRFALGESPSSDVIDRLEKDTGGNPFFLQETLRTLMNYPSSLSLVEMLDRLPLAPTISAMVYERLRPLSSQARQMVEVLAVLGSQFSPGLAESASGYPPDSAVTILEELEKAHFIRPVRTGLYEGYEFSHDKLREVILLSLSPARKRIYHLRAARAISTNQNFYQTSDVDLADHYQQAGEYSLAFNHWLNAANYAMRISAPGESTRAFRHAAQLIGSLNTIISEEEIRGLYSAWISLAYDLNDKVMLGEVSQEVFQMGQSVNSLLLKGIGLSGQALKAINDFQYEQALMLIDRALQFIQPTQHKVEIARNFTRRGLVLILLDRNVEAAASLQQALDLAGEDENEELLEIRARASHRLAVQKGLTGWPEQAAQIARNNFERNKSMHQPYLQAYACFTLGMSLFYLGGYREALQNLQEGSQLARRMQAWRLVAMILIWQARVELTMGHLDTCWEIVQEGLEISRKRNLIDIQAEFFAVLGEIFHLVDENEKARESFLHGAEIADNSFNILDNKFRLASLLAETDQVDEASQLIQDVISQAEKAGLGLIHIPAQFTLVNILIKRGQLPQAEAQLHSLTEQVRERRLNTMFYRISFLECAVAIRRGDYSQAQTCAEAVINGGMNLENPYVEMAGYKILSQIPETEGFIQKRINRIRELLNGIQNHTQNPLLAAGWQRYVQNSFPADWQNAPIGNVLTTLK